MRHWELQGEQTDRWMSRQTVLTPPRVWPKSIRLSFRRNFDHSWSLLMFIWTTVCHLKLFHPDTFLLFMKPLWPLTPASLHSWWPSTKPHSSTENYRLLLHQGSGLKFIQICAGNTLTTDFQNYEPEQETWVWFRKKTLNSRWVHHCRRAGWIPFIFRLVMSPEDIRNTSLWNHK